MGFKKNNPGCGCCANPSACEICCENGIAEQIKVTMPSGLFSNGTFCGGCASIAGGEVYLDNVTFLNPCDWVLVDDEALCGGSTLRQWSLIVRRYTSPSPYCEVTFTFAITCSGFATFYTWSKEIADDESCSEVELEYVGATGDGDCCTITGAPGNVTVDFNP